MLRNIKDLQGYGIHAADGDIGQVSDFFFDDEKWGVRYLIADTGTWLIGHLVLIPNHSINAIKWDERQIFVNLTCKQVENAPSIETNQPVTRQHEADLSAYYGYPYYGYPYYWSGAGMYDTSIYPELLAAPDESAVTGIPAVAGVMEQTSEDLQPKDLQPKDSHLQSANDVTGFHIEAADGELGHVEDFIIDDGNWTVRYIEVDTRNWWPGKKVLLAPGWIQHINWQVGRVRVNLLREIIQNAPEYDPTRPITRQDEISLFDYYGQYLDSAARSGTSIP